jgi:flavin reductase (DIM6/NTAB) family NADH-FMN oxidoreductase RutF
MEDLFQSILPEDINDNIFRLINEDWMLITAGTEVHYNMMTASWGGAGYLWRKHIAMVFIRPQRHTFLFMEENPYFTLSFFDQQHRDVLNYCGTYSGKDVNKMALEGLDPILSPKGNIFYKQARMVIECRKIYQDDIKPEHFLSFDLEKIYAKHDYHRFYIGEIAGVWRKKQE